MSIPHDSGFSDMFIISTLELIIIQNLFFPWRSHEYLGGMEALVDTLMGRPKFMLVSKLGASAQ